MTAPTGRPTGRPSIFSDELAATLCERLANGELLTAIERDDGMPGYATVYRWLETNTAFREQYARAREIGWSRLSEEVLELSDDSRHDWITEDGERRIDHENVQRSRLMVDTRKWLLSKVLPKIYGDKLALTDANGGPLAIQVVRFDMPAAAAVPELRDVTPARQVIEHAAAHAPQAPDHAQPIEKSEDDKS